MSGKKYNITNELHSLLGDKITKANILNLTFNNVKFTFDLESELFIDKDNMIDSMLAHTTNFGWWASLKLTAETALETLYTELHYAKGSTSDTQEVQAKKTKKHDEVRSLERIVKLTNTVLQSYEHRRDMLKEINKAQCNIKTNQGYN